MDRSALIASVMGTLSGKGKSPPAIIDGGAGRLEAHGGVQGRAGGKHSVAKKPVPDIVAVAREAFRSRGFSYVSELFVYVDAEGRDHVTCQGMERAVKSLKLETIFSVQDLMTAVGVKVCLCQRVYDCSLVPAF